MARRLRIKRAGAWCHVTARGLEQRRIFTDSKDRRPWFELLRQAVDLWRMVVHGDVQTLRATTARLSIRWKLRLNAKGS